MTTDVLTFEEQWRQWHDQHESNRANPHGFLAITGIHWLTREWQRFPGAPGRWTTTDGAVHLRLDEGEELIVAGTAVRGAHVFQPIEERGNINAIWGDAVIEIARRGGNDIVRPRHPDHPIRTGYRGTPAYAPDRRWVAAGRYLPFDEPRPTTVGSVVDELRHVYAAPGQVEFELDGQLLRLTVFDGYTPGTFNVLFTDATSGVTTYPANRSLQIAEPDSSGNVLLDFNRAVNLPCAYTEYATCPLPPAENRLPVAIEAGERYPV